MLASSARLSCSLTVPRYVVAARTARSAPSNASSSSPVPATSSRTPGRSASTRRIAASSVGRPLRGSLIRPMNPSVPPSPCHCGRAAAPANRSTYTPFGISTASPPRCSTRVRRASSDTAIRPAMRSSAG